LVAVVVVEAVLAFGVGAAVEVEAEVEFPNEVSRGLLLSKSEKIASQSCCTSCGVLCTPLAVVAEGALMPEKGL